MIRRSTVLVFEIVIGILALLTIPAAVLLWRLGSGPVEVSFLTPYMEEAFQEAAPDSKVEIGATVLEWQGLSRSIDLRARDVRLLDLQDDLALALPEISVKLSVRALLHGVVAPTVIKIRDAYLYLVRQKDGGLILKYATEEAAAESAAELATELADEAAPGTQVGAALPDFLNQLVPEPNPTQPLTLLNQVLVESSTVFILDEKANRTWRFPLSNLNLERDELGLNGDLALTLGSGTAAPSLEAAFLYDKETGILDLSAGFQDVAPAELADFSEDLAPLRALHLSLAGNVSTGMDATGRFSPLNFTLQGGLGEVDLSAVGRPNLAVRSISLPGRLDHEAGTLVLGPARLELGTKDVVGSSLGMTATVIQDVAQTGRYLVAAEASAENVVFNDLENYWPEDMALNARPWVTGNLRDGIADRFSFQTNLVVSLPDAGSEEREGNAVEEDQGTENQDSGEAPALPDDLAADLSVELQTLEGDFTFHDVSIHYFRPLPPATGVAGTASFDRDGFDIALSAGHVGAIKLSKGAVKIRGLMLKEGQLDTFEEIWIDLDSKGPVAEALALLNHEELDLISHLGISPEGSEGISQTHLNFYFPLKHSLTFADVEVASQSEVEGLRLRGMAMGHDISDGQATIDINNAGMRVTGKAKVAAVPFDIDWSEAFDDSKGYLRHIRAVTTRLDDAGREALDIDFGSVLTGPLGVSLSLTLKEDGAGDVQVAANLQEAAISVPALNWRKTSGTAGEAYISLKLQDMTPVSYDQINVSAGELEVEGRGQPAADGRGIETLSLKRLQFPGGTLQNVSVALGKTPIDITITDGRINAAYFRDDNDDDSTTATDEEATPFTLKAAHLTAVDFGKGRQLHDVTLELAQDQDGWQRVFLFGEVPEDYWTPDRFFVSETAETPSGGLTGRDGTEAAAPVESELAAKNEVPAHRQVLIDLAPTPDGGRTLKVETNDFGGALRAMDVIDTLRGGNFTLTGTSPGPIGDSRLDAKIQAEDFFIVDAPVMARLFSVASITGGLELLTNEGLYMREMVGDFTVEDWVARSDLLRVYGNAVGLTAQGSVDLGADVLDLRGTLVPAYTINRLLGGIPVIGRLLVGGEGEGILAITYSVKGSMEDPEVSVNPLSVLAPGFLRGLFTGSDGDGEEPRAFPQQLEKRNKLQ